MKSYLIVYLGSAVLSLMITPVVVRLARKLSLVDLPGARKIHASPIPRVGGIAIFLSAMCLVLPVMLLENAVGDSFRQNQSKIITLLACCGFVFLVGLLDDIKGLRARTKFAAQFIAAIAVCSVGIRVETIAIGELLRLEFGIYSWPLTVLWITGITNAMNLTDGLDGLAAGISAIACGVIAVLAVLSGNVVMAILMLALLGSLSGFLFFNFNPAKVFMGDCGSMFVGFTIATSSVLCAVKTGTIVALALPALALGIPIFDTLLSMLRRFLERRSMFSPDRGHFHHRLLDLGLRQRHVAITAYAVTLLAAGLGMFMMVAKDGATLLLVFASVLLLLLLLFRVVGSVSVRKTILGVKDKYAVSSREKDEIRSFEASLLHFDKIENFQQWWQALCEAGETMKLAWVSLKAADDEDASTTWVWRFQGFELGERIIVTTVPITDPQTDKPLLCEIAVPINGSLESANHRILLFCRLFEQDGFASLLSGPRMESADHGYSPEIN